MLDSAGGLTSAFAEASRGHLQLIYELLRSLGGRTSPADQIEEELFRIREGFHEYKLEAVEQSAPGTDFRNFASGGGGKQLVHFARILQRTQLIGHFVHKGCEVPIHYAINGAVILERRGRRFTLWGRPLLTTSVMLPFAFVDDKSILSRFKDPECELVDTGGDRMEYTQLRISAVKKAQERAVELRNRLYDQWHAAEGANANDILSIHGHVVDLPNDRLAPNCLALDMRVYLPWQNSELLEQMLQIPPGQRGPLLKVMHTVGDPRPKYLWFVRLRTSSKADPEFGLLNCNIIANSDQEAIVRANEFSALVMAERLPVSFPAEGWDKLIFPLKLCQDYLASLLPSRETVKSFFARV